MFAAVYKKYFTIIKFEIVGNNNLQWLMHNDELLKAIRMIGSQQKLARELGITRSTINHWLNRGTTVPLCSALSIEVLTAGLVKAEALAPHLKEPIFNFKDYLQRKFKENENVTTSNPKRTSITSVSHKN